jgi:ribosomal-protein-alanine N-acetyltransferase
MGKERFAPPAVRLSVASFNRRAVTVYKRAGFQIIGEEKVRTNGGIYNFIKMELDQSNGNQASDSKRH